MQYNRKLTAFFLLIILGSAVFTYDISYAQAFDDETLQKLSESEKAISAKMAELEQIFITLLENGNEQTLKQFETQSQKLSSIIIRDLKKDTIEGVNNFYTFISMIEKKKPLLVKMYGNVTKNIYDRLKWDLCMCEQKGKPRDVIAKIKIYMAKVEVLNDLIARMPAPTKQERLEQVGKIRQGFTFNDETPVFGNVQSADNNDVVCINGSNAAKDSQPASPYQHDNSNNTVMDKIHRFFNKLKDKIAGPEENIKTNYTTREAADIIFSLIASKIVQGKNFKKKEVPMEFEISSNNVSTQYSQGNAFSKLKELIKKATEARKSGVTKGVFIVGHNFILSGEETAQKMSNLLINARNNGVPVLLSYDQFGTHIYASGALPVIDRMRKAGIGILTNASLMGDRMDHRKIYFIGTGDGHVACLAGGQGWCVQYSGKDWDNLPALTDEEGGAAQNGSGDETWMDHMRMVDGEAALQGSLHFIGCFTSQADIEVVIKGLALERLAKPQMKRYALVKEALENIFMPKLVQAGNQQAVILTNMTWSKRPITDVWYGCLSDPDVKEIRICMPYITDPVFRAKLKQAVKDGKDVRILIPGISDNFLSQMATKYHFHDLVQIHSELVEKSKNAGTLDLRTYQSKDGDPMMLHMKFGIFIHKVNNKEDTVIDGSYNATALEARAGERNADIMLKGKEPALKAADEFDELFKMAKKYEPSLKDKAGLPVMIILRPFM